MLTVIYVDKNIATSRIYSIFTLYTYNRFVKCSCANAFSSVTLASDHIDDAKRLGLSVDFNCHALRYLRCER